MVWRANQSSTYPDERAAGTASLDRVTARHCYCAALPSTPAPGQGVGARSTGSAAVKTSLYLSAWSGSALLVWSAWNSASTRSLWTWTSAAE